MGKRLTREENRAYLQRVAKGRRKVESSLRVKVVKKKTRSKPLVSMAEQLSNLQL